MRVIANRRGSRLMGFLLLVGFVLLVLLLTGWFVARTERVRKLLADELSDRFGVVVTVGESRIGWPYELVMRDVETDGFRAAGTPGFAIAEARLGRRLFSWQLSLRHVLLRVRQDSAGIWTPLVAARIADLRQASATDIVRLAEPLRHRLRLKISDGAIDWLDAEGRTEASLHDVCFRMQPVRLPERREMTYFSLSIYAASGGAFANARDLEWAWLTSDDFLYIELERSVRYEPGFGSTNTISQTGGEDVD